MIVKNLKRNHEEEKKVFGLALMRIRQEKQIRLKQLAGLSGVSLTTLKRMEKGNTNITFDNMLDIACALEVSLAYICLCAYSYEREVEVTDEHLQELGHKLLAQAVKRVR